MTGEQTRSDVLLELCGPSTGHPTRPGTAGLRPRVDTGQGGWGVEQGKSQAWGPMGSGASGTGVIAGSRGGEVCRSQQGAGVWVLLFSSRSNWENGRGISQQVPVREQSLLPGFTQKDEHRELVLWAREGLRR